MYRRLLEPDWMVIAIDKAAEQKNCAGLAVALFIYLTPFGFVGANLTSRLLIYFSCPTVAHGNGAASSSLLCSCSLPSSGVSLSSYLNR